MSKKLIAVAAAAALALTGLVGVAPANATYAFSVTPDGDLTSDAGITADAPLSIYVPSQDVLRWDNETADASKSSASVIRLVIQATTTASAVRVTSTGSVKLITEAQYSTSTNRKTATGVTSLDVTSNTSDGKAYVYAFTTSTAVGTVVVTNNGNSRTLHIQGDNVNNVSGSDDTAYAYKVAFTAPTTADVSDVITFTGSLLDAFGNKIEGLTGVATDNVALTHFGASAGTLGTGDDAWTESTTEDGVYTFGVNTSATAGQGIVGIAATTAPTKVTAFGDPVASQFFTFTTASLATQVTTLTAQVAALTAQLADSRPKATSVTKKKYNTLARKWNAAFPSQRVALKK